MRSEIQNQLARRLIHVFLCLNTNSPWLRCVPLGLTMSPWRTCVFRIICVQKPLSGSLLSVWFHVISCEPVKVESEILAKWNLIRTSYFQSVHVLILALPIFLWKLVLVFKTDHDVAVFMYPFISHQSTQQFPYITACRQEYWNRDDCFIAICKHAALLNLRNSLSVSTLTGSTSHKITRTNLIANSPRVVSAHILFRKHVFFKEDMVRGRNLTFGGFYLGKNKTLIHVSPASWIWISERINFDRFTNQFKYQASFDSKWIKTTGFR